MSSQPIKNGLKNIDKSNKRKYFYEDLSGKIFLLCALISVISLALIIGFVFYKGPSVCSGRIQFS